MLLSIVGTRFRPAPAKQLVASAPSGITLYLEAEPTNPYDPLAVKVLLKPKDCNEEKLHQLLQGTGISYEEIPLEEPIHIGYIPRDNEEMHKACLTNENVGAETTGTLQFDTKGWPHIFYDDSVPF